jgi:hypothetical protein
MEIAASGILRPVVSKELTDVSEVLTASIIRAVTYHLDGRSCKNHLAVS